MKPIGCRNLKKQIYSVLALLMCLLLCSGLLVSCHDSMTDDFGGLKSSEELNTFDTEGNTEEINEQTTKEQPTETGENTSGDPGYLNYAAYVFDEEGLYEFDLASGEKKLVFETECMVYKTLNSKVAMNRDDKIYYVLEDEYSYFATLRVADINSGERQVYEDVYLDIYENEQWISPTLLYIPTRRGGFAVIDIENKTYTHYMNMVFAIEMKRGKFVYTNESDRIYYPGDYYAELYYDGEVVFTHDLNRTYIEQIYAYGSDIILKVLFQPYVDDGMEFAEKERSFVVRGNIDEDGKFNVIYDCEVDNSLINNRMYFTEDGELCFASSYTVNRDDGTLNITEVYAYSKENNAFVKRAISSDEQLYDDYRTGPSTLPYDYPEASPTFEPMSPEENEKMSNASEEIKKILPEYFGEKAFLYSIFKKDAE